MIWLFVEYGYKYWSDKYDEVINMMKWYNKIWYDKINMIL